MARFRRRMNWKGLIAAVLVVASLIAAVAGIASFATKNTDTIGFGKFHRGAVNSVGEFVECKTSLYSDYIGAKGLSIEPAFEFDGTYEVFYYNYEKEFLNSTGEKTATDKVTNVNEVAAYARIVITPADGKDIALWDIAGIVKQFKITTLKDQDMNIFDPATGERNTVVGIKYEADENGSLIINPETGFADVEGLSFTSEKGTGYVKYAVNNSSEFLVVFDEGSVSERRELYVFVVGEDEYVHFEYIPVGVDEYRISLPENKYSTGATAIYINYDMNNPFELYRLR